MRIAFKDGIAVCVEGDKFLNLSAQQDKRDALLLLHHRCIQSYIIMLYKVPSKSGRSLLYSRQIKQLLLHLSQKADKGHHLHTEADVLPEHNNVVARSST